MNERAINLRDWEVRAFLDGRKSQIRRAVKPQPGPDGISDDVLPANPYGYAWRDASNGVWHCPFGYPGDRLWVRETWAHYQTVNSVHRHDGRSFSEVSDGLAGYRADGFDSIEDFRDHIRLMSGCDLEAVEINDDRWRPSIHMPRWASRITLEITGVRVERLQEISTDDCWAEGIPSSPDVDPLHEYRELWESTNGPGSWDANPWVWAIGVKAVQP